MSEERFLPISRALSLVNSQVGRIEPAFAGWRGRFRFVNCSFIGANRSSNGPRSFLALHGGALLANDTWA
jgi:hypothetical protein